MVQQVMQGGAGAAEIAPVPMGAAPMGAAPAGGAPDTAPAELEAALQQQQGIPPEQKRQMALQKLLKLRAVIDQMIRILQGQQQGQPPNWMERQEATEMARAPGHPGIPAWMGGATPQGEGV